MLLGLKQTLVEVLNELPLVVEVLSHLHLLVVRPAVLILIRLQVLTLLLQLRLGGGGLLLVVETSHVGSQV